MIEKKKKLKAMFDAEYDDKEGSSFYDDLKRDLDQQAQVSTSVQKQRPPYNIQLHIHMTMIDQLTLLGLFYLFISIFYTFSAIFLPFRRV